MLTYLDRGKFVSVLQKCTLLQQCRIQTCSLGQYTPDPSVRGEGSMFPFSEIVSTLSYCSTAMQNSKNQPGTKPRPTDLRFRRREVFFVLRKCTKTQLKQCRIQILSRDNTPDPRFRGEERSFLFPKNETNSPTVMPNLKNFRGTIYPGPSSQRRETFVFVLRKCTKTLL